MEHMIKARLRNFSAKPNVQRPILAWSFQPQVPFFFEGRIILKENSKGQLLSEHLLQHILKDFKIRINFRNFSLNIYGWQVFGIHKYYQNGSNKEV